MTMTRMPTLWLRIVGRRVAQEGVGMRRNGVLAVGRMVETSSIEVAQAPSSIPSSKIWRLGPSDVKVII